MHKIFKISTVKISCFRNISSIISSHNRDVLSPKQESFGCDCRVKNECPLNGECQTPSVIYGADVVNDSNNEETLYFGLTGNHNRDFNTGITIETLNIRSMKTVQN